MVSHEFPSLPSAFLPPYSSSPSSSSASASAHTSSFANADRPGQAPGGTWLQPDTFSVLSASPAPYAFQPHHSHHHHPPPSSFPVNAMDVRRQRDFQRSMTSELTQTPGPSLPASDRFRAIRSTSSSSADSHLLPNAFGLRRGSLPTPAVSPIPAMSIMQLRRASASSQASHSSGASSVGISSSSLSLPVLTMGLLAHGREAAFAGGDEWAMVQWAKRVIKYIERDFGTSTKLADSTLLRWVDEAMAIIGRRAAASPPNLEALYLRGDLKSSGNFPSYHVKDPRDAFNDFEKSGRGGFPASWYRIGRDYELHGSHSLGKDAFERGCQLRDIHSMYRMGRAYLFGQLKLRQDFDKAMPLLKGAAELASEDFAEPSFFYGLIHAGEYAHLNIPDHLVRPPSSTHTMCSPAQMARRYIERAAYLNHSAAQLRLGWAHEYSRLDCPFDPLLSVQYFSLASRGGKAEADVALSRWFLCGAEGCFDRNEALAFTFAEKAARRRLPSAEFALAYYFEVGVGCEKDVDLAMKWYRRSAAQGNVDAQERLTALTQSSESAVSRIQYEAELDLQITKKHTRAGKVQNSGGNDNQLPEGLRAMSLSDKSGSTALATTDPASTSRDVSRRRTLRMVNEVATAPLPQAMPSPSPSSVSSVTGTPHLQSRMTSSSEQGSHSGHGYNLASPQQHGYGNRPPISRTPSPLSRGGGGGGGGTGAEEHYRHIHPATPTALPRQRQASSPASLATHLNALPLSPPSSNDLRESARSDAVITNGPAAATATITTSTPPRRRRERSRSGNADTPVGAQGGRGDGRKYSTFAEMGIQSSAMDKEKDCLVM